MAKTVDQKELVESGRALRLGLRLLLFALFLYIAFWAIVAFYFDNAEHHKDLLETTLEKTFKRDVRINEIITTWKGLSPMVQINGFQVEGDQAEQPSLAFDSLSAEISPLSILRLWPLFNELTIQHPRLEITSLGSEGLMLAGIKLSPASQGSSSANPQRIIQWMGDHKNIAWANGEINWLRANGENHHYQDVSFLFSRQEQFREFDAVIDTPKGAIRFHSESNGNLFSENNWDADFQVLGNQGKQFLGPDDLSFAVNNGQGRLRIKTLDIERIRDFIQLSGLADKAAWLYDAQLSGRLHDAAFVFSGPLFAVSDWSLIASASDVNFKSTGSAPSMNNLEGSVNVSSTGGEFSFSTRNSVFNWDRWYDQGFPIDRAEGKFSWQIQDNGNIDLGLSNGHFEDKNARIFNLNARLDLAKKSQEVTSLNDLIKLISISPKSNQPTTDVSESVFKPPILNASAEFDVFKMETLDEYLPNDKRVGLLKRWWANAFKSGETTGAKLTYTGELSADAFFNGRAQLDGAGDFANVHVDYGYLQDWPEVKKGQGRVILKNDLFTLLPSEVWLGQDKVTKSKIDIVSLFSEKRAVVIESELTTSLANVTEFLFRGPLIKPENKPEELPVTVTDGAVTAQSVITVPLSKTTQTTVVAKARLKNGRVLLPPAVPMENISADINFTERSAEASNIKASFLGGDAEAQLETTKEAIPPDLKLSATGTATVEGVLPWTGEILGSCFVGQAPWQGTVDFKGADIAITTSSTLEGINVAVPPPLGKDFNEIRPFELKLNLSSKDQPQRLAIAYSDVLNAVFQTNPTKTDKTAPSFLDRTMISMRQSNFPGPAAGTLDLTDSSLNKANGSSSSLANGSSSSLANGSSSTANGLPELAEGINLDVQVDSIDVDAWSDSLVNLSQFETKAPVDNTDFLDAMRSVRIKAKNSIFLERSFGILELSAASVDGAYWIGSIGGPNANGTWQAQPRAVPANYVFNFSDFTLPDVINKNRQAAPINYNLIPSEYPTVSLNIENLRLAGRHLGALSLSGAPKEDRWQLNDFKIVHNGIRTEVSGGWANTEEQGSVSSFDYEVQVDEAEGALDELDFDGFIKKGTGSMEGKLNWLGAPHEFDYSRLGGDFYIRIRDGELEKVEAGTGKLLGLLNFNALARRLTFDFRDVFASGLTFDRMVYSGILADGEAIMREAYVLTPAVFVRLEGKLDLGKELVDMEIHIAPELAGNLVLLSALANPAAGAVVFLTQRIFKDEMRQASFRSYRALGTWQDFELVDLNEEDPDNDKKKVKDKKSN